MDANLQKCFEVALQNDFFCESVCVRVLPHLLDVADGQPDDQVHQDDHHLHHEQRKQTKDPDSVLTKKI